MDNTDKLVKMIKHVLDKYDSTQGEWTKTDRGAVWSHQDVPFTVSRYWWHGNEDSGWMYRVQYKDWTCDNNELISYLDKWMHAYLNRITVIKTRKQQSDAQELMQAIELITNQL